MECKQYCIKKKHTTYNIDNSGQTRDILSFRVLTINIKHLLLVFLSYLSIYHI